MKAARMKEGDAAIVIGVRSLLWLVQDLVSR